MSLSFALKEWNATISALEAGRQIVLLRKGGLADAEGVFALEAKQFWLASTVFHEDDSLVKAEHRDLLRDGISPRRSGVLSLTSWARVERRWAVPSGHENTFSTLQKLPHIWSETYLETRLNYLQDKPLTCLALRVYRLGQPLSVAWKTEYSGCKSWFEIEPDLLRGESTPALCDDEFETKIAEVESVLAESAGAVKLWRDS